MPSHETNYKKVKEFHKVFRREIAPSPTVPDRKVLMLRMRLIAEEYVELAKSANLDCFVQVHDPKSQETVEFHNIVKEMHDTIDLVEWSDGLADLLYVIYGAAIVTGIPIEQVFDIVHRSNMSKLDTDGNPILREDGKILKGNSYWAPTIAIDKLLAFLKETDEVAGNG